MPKLLLPPLLLPLLLLPELCQGCTFYVALAGSDANHGTTPSLPLKTVEAALTKRRSSCPANEFSSIILSEGAFYISNPPIALDASTAIRASHNASSVTLSAGFPLDANCWARAAAAEEEEGEGRGGAAVWKCTLGPDVPTINPATGEPFQTLYMNDIRLRKSRFPDYDKNREQEWLYINSSRWLGLENQSKFVVGIEASKLPSVMLDPGWKGGTLTIFPTRSWINIVNVTLGPLQHDSLATDNSDVSPTGQYKTSIDKAAPSIPVTEVGAFPPMKM